MMSFRETDNGVISSLLSSIMQLVLENKIMVSSSGMKHTDTLNSKETFGKMTFATSDR